MRFAVMVEGQEDVGWDDWVAIAGDCERLGFETLFRSDHYLSVDGIGGRGSLDAWATLSALAAVTSTLRLGTLVSPATFRHPSVLAKNVVTVDHVSGGRAELGIGTGWLEAEHVAYGFPFPPLGVRMDRLAEQVEIIRRSWERGPFSFAGEHWRIDELDALPKPVQRPGPPLIMGGAAGPRSARLARGNVRRLAGMFLFTGFAWYSAAMLLLVPLGWYAYLNGLDPLGMDPTRTPVWYTVSKNVLGQVSTVLMSPVGMMGLSLLYLDERVRHEGYDIELMAAQVFGEMPAVPAGLNAPLAPAIAAPHAPAPAPPPVAAAEKRPGSILGL